MRGGAFIAALIGASVTLGACADAEQCEQDHECGDVRPCRVDKCVDGLCHHITVPDGEKPHDGWSIPAHCERETCTGGEVKLVGDPTDLPPDDDPNDCKVPSCVPVEDFINRPNGAPCYFAIHIEGVCEVGKCQPPPSELCATYCNACPDTAKCPGCDVTSCVELCREAVLRPCGDELGAVMQCEIDAGACDTAGCGAEVELFDDCHTDCGVTCNGCGCNSSCDGHTFETTCNYVDNVNICQCIMDEQWVGECSEPNDAGCLAANLCCNFW